MRPDADETPKRAVADGAAPPALAVSGATEVIRAGAKLTPNALLPLASSKLESAFDYDTIAAEDADALRTEAERIRRLITKSTADLIEIGRNLIAVKAKLGHGKFLHWVESEIGIPRRSSQRYMGIADLAEAKGVMVSLLTPAAAYLLSAKSTPPDIVGDVIRRLEAGERITEDAVEGLVRSNKEQMHRERKSSGEKKAKPDPETVTIESSQEHGPVDDDDRVTALAEELFSKLGSDLTRFVLNAVKQDAQAVLDKLEEVWAISSARSVHSQEAASDGSPRILASSSQARIPGKCDMPDLPWFLDRRTQKEEDHEEDARCSLLSAPISNVLGSGE
jgi:hypothetical protein